MTLLEAERARFLNMVDSQRGLVEREIFSDPDIYQAELEQIFARSWLFLAHDSQIANPGDFFLAFMGGDRVIVVRDKEGKPQVLINSCRHRGNAVCRAEVGHATSFMCTYHGWTYDLKGALVSVPGFKEVYHEDINREEWGLIPAAHVDSYNGFIFATMDAKAPPLDDFLGEVGRLCIDYFNMSGEKEIMGVQKWQLGCNWKFAADNIWDWYHVTITHSSAGMASAVVGGANYVQRWSPSRKPQPEMVVMGEYGHAIGGARRVEGDTFRALGDDRELRERLGPVGKKMGGMAGIFPNLWITQGSIVVRVPMSATSTEMWRYSFIDKDSTEEQRARGVVGTSRSQGPAGTFEQDDGENWLMSTTGTMGPVIRRYPLNYQMSLGYGQVKEIEGGPPHIDSDNWTEHGQRWHYLNWAHWMAAVDWDELKQTHPSVPRGTV